MDTTTVAVDLAKNVFELAIANGRGHVIERRRLSRLAFSRFVFEQPASCVVMEACSGAHAWGRQFEAAGHKVVLLPAQYVAPYRRRNKTDRADCSALLEAVKNPEIRPVPIKTPAQQAIQGLHRLRAQWLSTRTARINTLRGLLRELGIALPLGVAAFRREAPVAIDQDQIPPILRPSLREILTEIHQLEARIQEIERRLTELAKADPAIIRLQQISGIGLLTATALVASVGSARHFRSGRHLAAWLGLTPREHSSGNNRRLGRISKRGDMYVRMLLTHGARSVLVRAKQQSLIRPEQINPLQRWVLDLERRAGHNKATCALANKLARIAWACWNYERDFNAGHALIASAT
jgi:transposase